MRTRRCFRIELVKESCGLRQGHCRKKGRIGDFEGSGCRIESAGRSRTS